MATLAPIKTPTRARDERTTFIQLLRRFHFHAGILVGPFLLVTAITGFLYALAPAAEQVTMPTRSTPAPRPRPSPSTDRSPRRRSSTRPCRSAGSSSASPATPPG